MLERKRVLLVEDDKVFAAINQRLLEQAGYEVAHALDGQAGLDEVGEWKPDVVVLDIGLPKLDGFALLERMKGDAEMRAVPVIMYSRLGAKEDVDKCLQLGACSYLMKSQHGPEDLLRCLTSALVAHAL